VQLYVLVFDCFQVVAVPHSSVQSPTSFVIITDLQVVAVPEGLPLAVTLALAFSVRRMLADHNLVRFCGCCLCELHVGQLRTSAAALVFDMRLISHGGLPLNANFLFFICLITRCAT